MKITFSSMLSTFVVHAPEGTLVSLSATPTEIGDGVYSVGDSGMVLVDEEYQTDTIYLSTEGEDYTVETGERICYPAEDIVVWGGNAPDRNPFKVSGKGGGGSGGDNTHYKGTTTTAISNGSTTNPITIDGESYTAVFGDIVVYGYTEFVFDGTTWSEFGRPFDTTPTSGSANAVTSDGIFKVTPLKRGAGARSVAQVLNSANGTDSAAFGYYTVAGNNMLAIGRFNDANASGYFNIGNGVDASHRSNILEANSTSVNINGDIRKNNVSLPTPYTTMPAITAGMVGQVAQYVGETTNDYVKGYFYIASSDGAAEPTYSWVPMVDTTPTAGSANAVTSDGVYKRTPLARGQGVGSAVGGTGNYAYNSYAMVVGQNNATSALASFVAGKNNSVSNSNTAPVVFGTFNSWLSQDLFEIGNGTANNARSNIVEVNQTSLNVNGDIKRDGVGIDDYTTTERKIGKWIDGSDLYQRTFEVTGLTESDRWVFNNNILGTSNIDIKDFKGYTEWSDGANTTRFDLNFYLSNGIHSLCLNSTSDLAISLNHESTSFVKAVITIKYTKISEQANTLNANIQQTEEPTDENR